MEGASAEQLLSLFDRSSGVTTDSRKCGPGLLYIALKGERFDGNTFAHDAIAPATSASRVQTVGAARSRAASQAMDRLAW